jgi:hypothetical protein
MGAGATLRIAFRIEHPDRKAAGDDAEFGAAGTCWGAGKGDEPAQGKQYSQCPAFVKSHSSPCAWPRKIQCAPTRERPPTLRRGRATSKGFLQRCK